MTAKNPNMAFTYRAKIRIMRADTYEQTHSVSDTVRAQNTIETKVIATRNNRAMVEKYFPGYKLIEITFCHIDLASDCY